MPKNVQTTTQLHSFHMLSRSCSKSFKLGLNSTRTENFQMFKLDLEKAEEPEIKLPTFVWITGKAREFHKNIYFCFTDYAKAFVCITTNWKILKDMGIADHLTCLLRNLYAGQEATVRAGHWKNRLGHNQERSTYWGCMLPPRLFYLQAHKTC